MAILTTPWLSRRRAGGAGLARSAAITRRTRLTGALIAACHVVVTSSRTSHQIRRRNQAATRNGNSAAVRAARSVRAARRLTVIGRLNPCARLESRTEEFFRG
jgi:hypothetical protein